MPKKPPPINLGLIPTVNEENIDIEAGTQYNIGDDANVVSAQNVHLIDENNTFPGEMEIALPINTTPIATPVNERSGMTTDTIVISGVITTIGAILGAAIAVGIETIEEATESKDFQSDEYKDSVQDSSTKYAAIGGAAGGALGLLTSLVLSRYVADFGDLSRALVNNAQMSIRERANEFNESIEEMRDAWRNFTHIFSGNNEQEAQAQGQDPNERQGMELTRAQIHHSSGAFASNTQAHSDNADTFEARNAEGAKLELARRSDQSRLAAENHETTSRNINEYDVPEMGVARMSSNYDSNSSYESDYDIDNQATKENLKDPPLSSSEDERKPPAKKDPPRHQESSHSISSSEMYSSTEHSINSDDSSIRSGEYADDERSVDDSTKWQDKHKKPSTDRTKHR